jgi:CBS domain-containing protein
MPSAFNFAASPFDCLTPDERERVRESVDIAYFREGETLLDPAREPTHLFVVIKGHVRELDGDEVVATFSRDDAFDGRSLVAGRAIHRFIAAEEVIAYELARAAVQGLIASNATFGALLFADLSQKLGALSERHGLREVQALSMAQVGQAFLRPAHVVDARTNVVEVARLFQTQRTSSVLVQGGNGVDGPLGIFTTTGLQRAILDGRPLAELAVGELATPRLVTVAPEAPLFDALALMIKHQVHRLVVMEGERVVGMLEQLDALSFVSNHSYLITVQIAQAVDLDTLATAAQRITRLIALLHRGGTRVGQIAKLVQELNAKLFERAWQLIAPPELVANSCLFVMGSEGRGEQLLRTDQDNGLVVRDGFDAAGLDEACQRFSDALQHFGYPECPGGIMVSRPAWRRSAAGFADTVRHWLLQPDAQSLMALAIFVDAHAVAGDPALLAGVRGAMEGLIAADDALLSRFAAAIDAFPELGASAWWSRLFTVPSDDSGVDLKKAGIFPIVHGVRSLALQLGGAMPTGTAQRLDVLVAAGRLPSSLAVDLLGSLHFLMDLKLQAGLAEIDLGLPASGAVHPARLSSLDRDLLKDALAVVKRFRALVRHHFHLSV